MLSTIQSSQYRRAVLSSVGLAVLWIVVAFIRSGATFHLAPILVAASLPILAAYDSEDRITITELTIASVAGLTIALLATLLLTVADQLTGPSLLPFGGAVTESVVFAIGGAVAGFGIGLLQRNR